MCRGLAGPIGRAGRACGDGFGVLKHLELAATRIFGGGRVQKSGPLSSYDLFLGVFSMSSTILVDVQWLF